MKLFVINLVDAIQVVPILIVDSKEKALEIINKFKLFQKEILDSESWNFWSTEMFISKDKTFLKDLLSCIKNKNPFTDFDINLIRKDYFEYIYLNFVGVKKL